MNNDFKQRLAVVTGASSGIGLAVTRQLLERGAQVITMSRQLGELGALAERFGEQLSGCQVTSPRLPIRRVSHIWPRPSARWIFSYPTPG